MFKNEACNDFSYWYPKIEDCGIQTPKSVIIKVPEDMYNHFYMGNYTEDYKAIDNWIEEVVKPKLEKAKLDSLLFIKNARFSNKFDARTCMATRETLTYAITNINYQALCVGADGINEMVIRERIRHDSRKVPCIYNGLPLRSEFRVFYDFDTNKVLYTANYWEYDYVSKNLYDSTDRIIFRHMKNKIEAEFENRKAEISNLVAIHMKNVQDLEGRWSIDIMIDDSGKPWLIDMAIAERSTYWDQNLADDICGLYTKGKQEDVNEDRKSSNIDGDTQMGGEDGTLRYIQIQE